MRIARSIPTTLLVSLSTTSFAADLPARNVTPIFSPEPASSWTGFYVGGNIGYGFGDGRTSFTTYPTSGAGTHLVPTALAPHADGVLGGGQIGYNLQHGRVVVGVEADFQGAGLDGSATRSPFLQTNGVISPAGSALIAQQRLDWFGTVRVRAGTIVVDPRLFLYATGGLAYGHAAYATNVDFRTINGQQYPASYAQTRPGWTAGAGAEYAISRNWSVKVEYLHIDLGSTLAQGLPVIPTTFSHGYSSRFTAELARVGVNYKFDTTPAAIVARY